MADSAPDRAKGLLWRLQPHGLTGRLPVCGFYHRDDQAIIRRLADEGRVVAWPGEGRDQGLILARLAFAKPAAVRENRDEA